MVGRATLKAGGILANIFTWEDVPMASCGYDDVMLWKALRKGQVKIIWKCL